jgi:hypothetical protein
MTATPLGAAHLLDGVIFPPLPSSPVSFPSKNVDHVGRTMTVPVASLPPLRRRLGSSGGVRLLSSESFRFYAFLRSVGSTLFGLRRSLSGGCFATPLRWRILCRRYVLADALPPSSCWLGIASGGCFAAMVGWSGGCFAILVAL